MLSRLRISGLGLQPKPCRASSRSVCSPSNQHTPKDREIIFIHSKEEFKHHIRALKLAPLSHFKPVTFISDLHTWGWRDWVCEDGVIADIWNCIRLRPAAQHLGFVHLDLVELPSAAHDAIFRVLRNEWEGTSLALRSTPYATFSDSDTGLEFIPDGIFGSPEGHSSDGATPLEVGFLQPIESLIDDAVYWSTRRYRSVLMFDLKTSPQGTAIGCYFWTHAELLQALPAVATFNASAKGPNDLNTLLSHLPAIQAKFSNYELEGYQRVTSQSDFDIELPLEPMLQRGTVPHIFPETEALKLSEDGKWRISAFKVLKEVCFALAGDQSNADKVTIADQGLNAGIASHGDVKTAMSQIPRLNLEEFMAATRDLSASLKASSADSVALSSSKLAAEAHVNRAATEFLLANRGVKTTRTILDAAKKIIDEELNSYPDISEDSKEQNSERQRLIEQLMRCTWSQESPLPVTPTPTTKRSARKYRRL